MFEVDPHFTKENKRRGKGKGRGRVKMEKKRKWGKEWKRIRGKERDSKETHPEQYDYEDCPTATKIRLKRKKGRIIVGQRALYRKSQYERSRQVDKIERKKAPEKTFERRFYHVRNRWSPHKEQKPLEKKKKKISHDKKEKKRNLERKNSRFNKLSTHCLIEEDYPTMGKKSEKYDVSKGLDWYQHEQKVCMHFYEDEESDDMHFYEDESEPFPKATTKKIEKEMFLKEERKRLNAIIKSISFLNNTASKIRTKLEEEESDPYGHRPSYHELFGGSSSDGYTYGQQSSDHELYGGSFSDDGFY